MIWVELVCDVCCDVFTGGVGPAALRRGAKRAGWVYTRDRDDGRMIDLCRKCHDVRNVDPARASALGRKSGDD